MFNVFFSKREELPYFKLKPHRLAIWYINKSNKHTPKYFSKKSFEHIIKLEPKARSLVGDASISGTSCFMPACQCSPIIIKAKLYSHTESRRLSFPVSTTETVELLDDLEPDPPQVPKKTIQKSASEHPKPK